ncbi:MAG: helix-turn-helix domain-containing protein [Deltaproteobacteria bacterium]|nr:helix-turn-helix domain-containing protein [Deltaproteobacteria bacterium]MBW2306810.1 helix-turn-helix domain-containing protein [Deltaproteobacteria bacterium]
MEAWEIRHIRQKLGATQEDLARIMKTSLATFNRWESGSAPISPKKAAILEAVNSLAERLERIQSRKSYGGNATEQLRTVLIRMGAENFLFLVAKEKRDSLPRSCWRRLSAAIPAIGLVVGVPVGTLGAMCGSRLVRDVLEILGESNRGNKK